MPKLNFYQKYRYLNTSSEQAVTIHTISQELFTARSELNVSGGTKNIYGSKSQQTLTISIFCLYIFKGMLFIKSQPCGFE